MSTITIQMRSKGTITIPQDIRQRYRLSEGDVLTLTDLGDGAFLLTPGVSEVARLGDEVARILQREGITADELIAALDDERETYYQEHYGRTGTLPR